MIPCRSSSRCRSDRAEGYLTSRTIPSYNHAGVRLGLSTPLVSIVVPTRNEGATIQACLEALLGQDYPADQLEILVVDGLSTDDTREVVAAIAATDGRVRMLDNEQRVTPAAFNLGIGMALGGVIGVMSAHGIPAHDYVSQAVRELHEREAWCVGGRIDRVATTPVQRAIAAATASPFGVGDASHNYRTTAGWVDTAFPGMWPRWVFDRIGRFDPELVRNQDDEFSYRIREAGGGVWFSPEIVVAYVPRGSFRALFSQYRQYGMWKVRVFQKHRGAARIRHLIPAMWVAALISGVVLALVALPAILLTVVSGLSYVAVMTVASLRLRRDGTRATDVFRALLSLHLAYGVGFLQGLVRFAPHWVRSRKSEAGPGRADA